MRSWELKKQTKNTLRVCYFLCSVLIKYVYTHGESINSKMAWWNSKFHASVFYSFVSIAKILQFLLK